MTTLVEETAPTDWRHLQEQAAALLREAGLHAESDVPVQLVRGAVRVDVRAEDRAHSPPLVCLCECKHWASAVPQREVHAFRTVVSDSGANVGYFISSSGYQSGALEAAGASNVRLATWEEFQGLFADRWFSNYFVPTFKSAADRLAGWAEPIACVRPMSAAVRREFDALVEPWLGVGQLALSLYGMRAAAMFASSSARNERQEFLLKAEKLRGDLSPDFFRLRSLRGRLTYLVEIAKRARGEVDAFYAANGITPVEPKSSPASG